MTTREDGPGRTADSVGASLIDRGLLEGEVERLIRNEWLDGGSARAALRRIALLIEGTAAPAARFRRALETLVEDAFRASDRMTRRGRHTDHELLMAEGPEAMIAWLIANRHQKRFMEDFPELLMAAG